jgi:zinc D-Ala-D-Ala dipeptidase
MKLRSRTQRAWIEKLSVQALVILGLCWQSAYIGWAADNKSPLPNGFVYLEHIIPSVEMDIRYFTTDNFVGQRIDGYLAPKCILTAQAAEALKQVQADLDPFGLGLKVFDCYRPQRAVDQFIRWAHDLADIKMKNVFYPDVGKENLFKEGYIAGPSSHSRGSTVDLTIVSQSENGTEGELEMGSHFDLFSPRSWPMSAEITSSQRAHRMLLRLLMMKHGFVPYPQEWWHFTLKQEPYPNTYFNFPVQ